MKDTNKDFSGQLKEVTISTSGAAKDHKVKTIKADRTGEALRRVLPPTPLSRNSGK